MKRVAWMAVALAAAGCTRTIEFYPANDAAQARGNPTGQLHAQGIPRGPIEVQMPDGELLTGHFQVSDDSIVSSGFAYDSRGHSAFGTSVTSAGERHAAAAATGPKGTTITCDASAEMGAHGTGECEVMPGGARYRIMF